MVTIRAKYNKSYDLQITTLQVLLSCLCWVLLHYVRENILFNCVDVVLLWPLGSGWRFYFILLFMGF